MMQTHGVEISIAGDVGEMVRDTRHWSNLLSLYICLRVNLLL